MSRRRESGALVLLATAASLALGAGRFSIEPQHPERGLPRARRRPDRN
jgi:hypothetical protein